MLCLDNYLYYNNSVTSTKKNNNFFIKLLTTSNVISSVHIVNETISNVNFCFHKKSLAIRPSRFGCTLLTPKSLNSMERSIPQKVFFLVSYSFFLLYSKNAIWSTHRWDSIANQCIYRLLREQIQLRHQ